MGADILFKIPVGGTNIIITTSVVTQWVIMLLIIIAVTIITNKMKTVPKGKQVWAELIVGSINNLVKENMGEEFKAFIPYIGTIMIFLLIMNLTGIVGVEPPTMDYSVALALALVSFLIIHFTAIRRNGAGHYLAGYAQPYAFMLPLTIIERVVVPVSLSLRLFGNMTAAGIIMGLIYGGLASISGLLHLHIPLLQTIIPIPFHLYFDLFDGAIQMFIFSMLTMIFIKTTTEH